MRGFQKWRCEVARPYYFVWTGDQACKGVRSNMAETKDVFVSSRVQHLSYDCSHEIRVLHNRHIPFIWDRIYSACRVDRLRANLLPIKRVKFSRWSSYIDSTNCANLNTTLKYCRGFFSESLHQTENYYYCWSIKMICIWIGFSRNYILMFQLGRTRSKII